MKQSIVLLPILLIWISDCIQIGNVTIDTIPKATGFRIQINAKERYQFKLKLYNETEIGPFDKNRNFFEITSREDLEEYSRLQISIKKNYDEDKWSEWSEEFFPSHFLFSKFEFFAGKDSLILFKEEHGEMVNVEIQEEDSNTYGFFPYKNIVMQENGRAGNERRIKLEEGKTYRLRYQSCPGHLGDCRDFSDWRYFRAECSSCFVPRGEINVDDTIDYINSISYGDDSLIIQLIGGPSVGKSTFIAMLQSIVNQKYTLKKVVIGHFFGSVTRTFEKHDINQIRNVFVRDAPGFDEPWGLYIQKHAIEGFFNDSIHLRDILDCTGNDLYEPREIFREKLEKCYPLNDPREEAHALIFIFPFDKLIDLDAINRYRELIQQLSLLEREYIVLLTKFDDFKLQPKSRSIDFTSLESVLSDPIMNQYLNNVADVLSIHRTMVFPLFGFLTEVQFEAAPQYQKGWNLFLFSKVVKIAQNFKEYKSGKIRNIDL